MADDNATETPAEKAAREKREQEALVVRLFDR